MSLKTSACVLNSIQDLNFIWGIQSELNGKREAGGASTELGPSKKRKYYRVRLSVQPW